MNRFVKYIAYLQMMGIILVVFGHSFHEYPYCPYNDLFIYRIMHAFRMPLFMFVSGLLMAYTTEFRPHARRPSAGKFVLTKVDRILIPYLVILTLTFIPRTLLSGYADSEVDLSFSEFLNSLIHGSTLIIPYYWFLQASFILLTVCYGIITLCKNIGVPDFISYSILILISLLLLVLPLEYSDFLSINEVAQLGIFFTVGAFCGRYFEAFDRIPVFNSPLFLLIFLALFVVLFFLTENTSWIIFCSFAGIFMSITFAKILENKHITVLDHLIGANYIIFLLSWFFNTFSQQFLHHYIDLPWYIFTLLSLLTGVYIPFLIYHLMEKHSSNKAVKIMARLLGQTFHKNKIQPAPKK